MGLGGGGNANIAALPNPITAELTTLTAGSEGATMTAANLKTLEPSQIARLDSVFPHESYWEAAFGVETSVRAIALVNNSLVPGDQIRVVGVESGSLPAVRSQTIAPTAIEEDDSMLDAVLGDINEHPSTPDGDKTTFFTDGSFIRLSFPTPSSAPASGAGMQAFLLWVNTSSTPTNPADYPSLVCELWESGSFVASLGEKTPTSTTGQLLIFPWTSADLSSSDGSGVEVKIIQNQPAGFRVVLMDAISWECLHQTAEDAADFDTGWETIEGAATEPSWGGTALQQVQLPPPSWSYLHSTTLQLSSIRVEIRADGVGFFINLQESPPRTPATFIDAGILVAGPSFELIYNFAPGFGLKVASTVIGASESIGGQTFAAAVGRRRVAENIQFIIPSVGGSEIFSRIDYAAAGVQPFLVILAPGDDPRVQRHTNLWVTAADSGGMTWSGWFLPENGTLKDEVVMRYTFVEKL